jgi:predicted nucleic acid-binding protein
LQVVVDTNAIVADYWLRSRRWRLLLRRAEDGLVDLHVPEPVLQETLKHFRTDLEEAAKALSTAQRLAGRVLLAERVKAVVDIEGEVSAYEEHLRRALTLADTSFDVPTVDPAEVADRVIRRAKPFKDDGSGYVDMLVWLRVRQLADDDDVALISDNRQDFGGSKNGGLDSELEDELAGRQVTGRVTRYSSPSDFHAAVFDHVDRYFADISEGLADAAILDGIKEGAYDLLAGREARETAVWGSVAGPDDVYLVGGEIKRIELVEVSDADADGGYATLEAWGTAAYELPALQSEAWEGYEDGAVNDVVEIGEDDFLVYVTRTVRLHLWFDAHYDPESRRLSGFELTSAEVE